GNSGQWGSRGGNCSRLPYRTRRESDTGFIFTPIQPRYACTIIVTHINPVPRGRNIVSIQIQIVPYHTSVDVVDASMLNFIYPLVQYGCRLGGGIAITGQRRIAGTNHDNVTM